MDTSASYVLFKGLCGKWQNLQVWRSCDLWLPHLCSQHEFANITHAVSLITSITRSDKPSGHSTHFVDTHTNSSSFRREWTASSAFIAPFHLPHNCATLSHPERVCAAGSCLTIPSCFLAVTPKSITDRPELKQDKYICITRKDFDAFHSVFGNFSHLLNHAVICLLVSLFRSSRRLCNPR